MPLTSLDDDIAETRQRIAELDGAVTLVGDSYLRRRGRQVDQIVVSALDPTALAECTLVGSSRCVTPSLVSREIQRSYG